MSFAELLHLDTNTIMSSSKILVKDNEKWETDISSSTNCETAPASNGACGTGFDNCSRPCTPNTVEPSFDIPDAHDMMDTEQERQVKFVKL